MMNAMSASQAECVAAYEQARRWGNRVSRLQVSLCRGWIKWRLKRKGDDVHRLQLIALEHGLEANKT